MIHVEEWQDAEFPEDPKPALIFSIPKEWGFDIFAFWEKLAEEIYKIIDPSCMYTSVREV